MFIQLLTLSLCVALIRFNQCAEAKDWEEAVAALEERILLDPNDTPAEVTAFFYLADPQCLGDYERAFAFVDRLTRARWNDIRTLPHWAWRLASDGRIEVKDIALATRLPDRLKN